MYRIKYSPRPLANVIKMEEKEGGKKIEKRGMSDTFFNHIDIISAIVMKKVKKSMNNE